MNNPSPFTTPILGIAGRLQAGKTTFAKMVASHFEQVSYVNFADELKAIAKRMGWNGEKDAKGRRLLQLIGSECGRQCISEDIWVNHWMVRANAACLRNPEGCDPVITHDLRFPNELSRMAECGALLVKIKRKAVEPTARTFDSPEAACIAVEESNHDSERPLPDELFHIIIDNDGEQDDMLPIAREVARMLKEKITA